ncbi:MAG: hypothetical protein RUDDFDWM_001978 [Candidatus Fervidibacterota bacterium]
MFGFERVVKCFCNGGIDEVTAYERRQETDTVRR